MKYADVVTTSCDLEITYYPFDTQLCGVQFETQTSNNDEIAIYERLPDPIDTHLFQEDGNWVLKGYTVGNTDNLARPGVQFYFLFERRTTYYVVTLILPVILLTVTCPVVFYLPLDSGEKMGFSITVLLSFAVYLTVISDMLPATSLQTSFLSVYLMMMLALSASSVLVTAFVLRLHFKPETERLGAAGACITRCLRGITCTTSGGGSKKGQVYEVNSDVTSEGGGAKEREVDEKEEEEGITWQELAVVLDWFCFLLFALIAVVSTSVLFIVMVVGSSNNAPELPNDPVF